MPSSRIVPQVPLPQKQMRLLIDSDVANEIDDLYAIALAIAHPARFDLCGFVATHFGSGADSTVKSFDLLKRLLEAAGKQDRYEVRCGGDPMQYEGTPALSKGVEFIIEQARASSESDPLWIVVLGAATNTASALLKAPEIKTRVRVVFHARCSRLWPQRTEQFNVCGDIIAAQTLLSCGVPLVWFDTGTQLLMSFEKSKELLEPIGRLGSFIHNYRNTSPRFNGPNKGFFDLGDIAWLIDPTLCNAEIIAAPRLERHLAFSFNVDYGSMLRVTNIDVSRTWDLFHSQLRKALACGDIA